MPVFLVQTFMRCCRLCTHVLLMYVTALCILSAVAVSQALCAVCQSVFHKPVQACNTEQLHFAQLQAVWLSAYQGDLDIRMRQDG